MGSSQAAMIRTSCNGVSVSGCKRLKHDLTADKIDPNSLLHDRHVCHRKREEGKNNNRRAASHLSKHKSGISAKNSVLPRCGSESEPNWPVWGCGRNLDPVDLQNQVRQSYGDHKEVQA